MKLEELHHTGQPVRYEKEYIKKDGTRVPIELLVHIVNDSDGKPQLYYSFISDITERKQAEAKINRQNVILNAINRVYEEAIHCETTEDLGGACLCIIESITNSKFSFIGEIGQDGLHHDIAISDPGWNLCAMNNKSGHHRLPGNFKIHGLYGRVLQDGRSLLTNDPSSHPDSIGVPEGHPRLTAFLGVPFIRDGRAVGMIGLGNREGGYRSEDQEAIEALTPTILECILGKRAEEALRESEERYRSLFNGMTEGFALHEIICDAKDEPCDYRFLDINPAFERLTGLNREDVIGKTHNEVLPDDDSLWVKAYGAVAITGEPTQFENYSPALGRHYEVFAYRPAPSQFAVVFKDITERKQS